MKVLLTRPTGRNQAMEHALTSLEVPYLVTPLINVEPIPFSTPPSALHHADIIIFVSTNAVEFASLALNNTWPTTIQYYAVGQATYDAFSKFNISGYQAPKDSQQTEGLLELTGLQPDVIAGKNVVIIRGNGGRETLAATLTQRGATVTYWEVYQRTCPSYESDVLVNTWQKFGIDTIMLTSGESLKNLLKLLPKEYFPWLQTCHIIVPSARVLSLAEAAGLKKLTNATAAHCNALIDAIQ